ncbi:MAG: DUF481 domain-containing protein [Maricaulaceae bacterium]
MFKPLLSGALVALAFSSPAYAGVADGWAGEASLSGSRTTGNTKTEDLGLALNLAKTDGVWRNKFNAAVDYGKTGGSKDKQRLALGYQIDRDVNERLYVYANADYFQDDFGAFKQGHFIGTGLGYKAILPEPVGWNLEAGLGYRSQKSRPVAPALPMTENELALRARSDFDYKFNDNVSLYNDTELLYSKSDTYVWNETGITAQLMGNLAARASYRVDHHSDVPVGTKKTDTITRIGVVYTIK